MKSSNVFLRPLQALSVLLSGLYCQWLLSKSERRRQRSRRLVSRRQKKYETQKLRNLLVILPLLIIIMKPLPIFAQTSETGYEDVLTEATYTREQVLDLLAIINEEADGAIGRAFDEGYKAGALDYAPKVAELEAEKSILQDELDRLKREKRLFPFSIIGSFSVGAVSGIVFELIRNGVSQ